MSPVLICQIRCFERLRTNIIDTCWKWIFDFAQFGATDWILKNTDWILKKIKIKKDVKNFHFVTTISKLSLWFIWTLFLNTVWVFQRCYDFCPPLCLASLCSAPDTPVSIPNHSRCLASCLVNVTIYSASLCLVSGLSYEGCCVLSPSAFAPLLSCQHLVWFI